MRNKYNHKFNILNLYDATVRGMRALPHLIFNRIKKRVDNDLIERLMLATTEVNGCELCSYAHTKMALKQGFSQEEINSFLSGSKAHVKEEENIAILFAQHYADTKAKPSKSSYEFLEETYGKKEAKIMVRAIQVIMMGNIQGIPISAFISRLKGNSYENSSLFYELLMILFTLIVYPFALVDAILRSIFRFPAIRFEKSTTE